MKALYVALLNENDEQISEKVCIPVSIGFMEDGKSSIFAHEEAYLIATEHADAYKMACGGKAEDFFTYPYYESIKTGEQHHISKGDLLWTDPDLIRALFDILDDFDA